MINIYNKSIFMRSKLDDCDIFQKMWIDFQEI